jgi:predicted unusual protein kinase regulating ubiquinone biosynthesis (AarF/ABC1/UbiB family)
VEKEGLDKKLLANRVADSFLKQIITTGYFHCDPHPGNLCVDTSGNLVYYDYGMMDELKPNVKNGFKKFCFALFEGGPFVSDIQIGKSAKKLVEAVEEAGVLARGADRFACEKLARYFIKSFKDTQAGRTKQSLKKTVGADVQALTDANVFRFPSTFTFIFRSLASVDGIGKGLDKDFDLGKLSQPFVERLIEKSNNYDDDFSKFIGTTSKATGLNLKDLDTAVRAPTKIAYIEETVRAMETGDLRIRVRSLENETAIERLSLKADASDSLIAASLFANAALAVSPRPLKLTAGALAVLFGAKTLGAKAKLKIFNKKQSRFEDKEFEET